MIPGDERGSALVAVVGVLSVMTLLATMSLMAGGADLVISKRLARERSAFYAAESALEATLEEFAAAGSTIPDEVFHAPWPAPGLAVRRWEDGGWALSRRICLIPDVDDTDGDPATTVVLFDRSFGYAASPLQRLGYPVLQLLVSAEGGESRQTIVAEVAPVTCAPEITAGWAASGALDLTGDIRVEGTEHLPALAGRSPARLFGGSVIEGDQIVDPDMVLPADVLPILNAGETLSVLENLPEPSPDGVHNGLFWSRGDYSGPLDGEGILVVHNPDFDPVKDEASRMAIEEGVFAEGYDPAYSHLDPSRQPARLEITVGGAFCGVIIADMIGNATAAFTLTGALVTLTRSSHAVTAFSPLLISGSSDAIERSGHGDLRYLTGFRPVSVTPERQDQCP